MEIVVDLKSPAARERQGEGATLITPSASNWLSSDDPFPSYSRTVLSDQAAPPTEASTTSIRISPGESRVY